MPVEDAGNPPIVMAVETSCDDTAIAILRGDRELLASVVSSQVKIHAPYGGVVPEVASRNHLRLLRPLMLKALNEAEVTLPEIAAFAATRGPGLATSLMTGASMAKGLALGLNKPFLAINHMEGHLLSPFFNSDIPIQSCVSLIVSGGHTMLVDVEGFGNYTLLGRTVDDAAGEAFDKVGKLLGLPYPGGPEIDRRSRDGNPARFAFPRSMLRSADSNFSFSGLKTAVRYKLPETSATDIDDLCASFQEAVVDVLVGKTVAAAKRVGKDLITVSGGVSCNSRLRARFESAAKETGLRLLLVKPEFSTDNAAMIAFVAAHKLRLGQSSLLTEDINPNLQLC